MTHRRPVISPFPGRAMRCLPTFALVLASFALVAAHGATAFAQQATRPIRVVVSGGLTLPQGDLKDFHDSGMHADASLLLTFAGFPLTLRPELSITRLKQKVPDYVINMLQASRASSVAAEETSETTQLLGAMGNIEVPLTAGLYVLGGVGLLNLDAASESETKLTMNAGAGFRFHMGRIDGFVEARLGTASYTAGTFGYTKAQFIPISFGLAF
jgi:hypothetical protein